MVRTRAATPGPLS